MNVKKFIETQVEEIKKTIGDGKAISALSGGVDSSACTVLAHPRIRNVNFPSFANSKPLWKG